MDIFYLIGGVIFDATSRCPTTKRVKKTYAPDERDRGWDPQALIGLKVGMSLGTCDADQKQRCTNSLASTIIRVSCYWRHINTV